MRKHYRILIKVIALLLLLLLIYWAPFLFLIHKTDRFIVKKMAELPRSDAALIFGAHITRKSELTPILRERVEVGEVIWKKKRVDRLVVSNMPRAARVMQQYLVKHQIPKGKIEIDPRAKSTPDTCRFEKRHYPGGRRVIFLSQGYHLPRLIYQCKKIGVEGIGFPVEQLGVIDRNGTPFITRYWIRGKRYFREAALVWLAILDIYK